jgi:o-succinylbenzoate---CoA ligase
MAGGHGQAGADRVTSIRCVLEEAGAISKNQPAIMQGDRVYLYSELDTLAATVAQRLRRAGVKPGEHIGLFMANDWRMLAIMMGILRAGAVACPLSTRLPREAVIGQMNELAAHRLVVFLDKTKGTLDGIETLSPDALLNHPEGASPGGYSMKLDDPAVIVFTSGSSGHPRPAVLTYGNLYYNARGANANMRLCSQDRWLLNLPLYHVSGLGVMMRCMLAGAAVVIPEGDETTQAALMRYRPTHVSLVPTQLGSLLRDTQGNPYESIKALLVGGAACPPGLAETARLRGWPLYLTYGMTEAGSQICTMPPDAPPKKRTTTSGCVLRHREVTIAEDGEILVRGPGVFAGYWKTGVGLEDACDREGWFRTGDRGAFDEDGYLIVHGRKDFMMISGGENIQPEEIELAMLALDGVEQVAVAAVAHPHYGQRPVAFVKASEIKAVEWMRELEQRLARFKVPDAIFPWPDEGPEAGGKVSRAWLAERAGELYRPG